MRGSELNPLARGGHSPRELRPRQRPIYVDGLIIICFQEPAAYLPLPWNATLSCGTYVFPGSTGPVRALTPSASFQPSPAQHPRHPSCRTAQAESHLDGFKAERGRPEVSLRTTSIDVPTSIPPTPSPIQEGPPTRGAPASRAHCLRGTPANPHPPTRPPSPPVTEFENGPQGIGIVRTQRGPEATVGIWARLAGGVKNGGWGGIPGEAVADLEFPGAPPAGPESLRSQASEVWSKSSSGTNSGSVGSNAGL